MLLDRFVGHEPRLAATDAAAAIARLDFTAESRPALLPYSPVSWGNPFQSLLYGALPSHNVRDVPAYTLSTTVQLAQAFQRDEPKVLAHLHWLNVVMQSATHHDDARGLLDRFIDNLGRLKDTGAGLLWTVHNVLPHDARFPDLELELRKAVIEHADAVHILSARTPELVSEHFVLPLDRTFHVPHPRYTGVYPQHLSREHARAELGIPQDANVFLLFGRIAPYKGVTELVEAFDAFSADKAGEVVLLLAGEPVRSAAMRDLFDTVASHRSVHGAFRSIPETQVQVFCNAADVMALPYRRSLNSGALHLALTFGLPVLIPRSSGEAEDVNPAWAQLYDDEIPGALVEALSEADTRLTTDAARLAAREAGARQLPSEVSRSFAAEVRHWLDTGAVLNPVSSTDAAPDPA